MNNKINRIKLAKMLMQFGELNTDKGVLLYEGILAVGLEVFIEREGELVPAEDGEYMVEDVKYIIKEGKIDAIEEPEVEEPVEDPAPAPVEENLEEEEPVEEEPVEDERDQKIKELEEKVAELETVISERDEIIKSRDEEIADLKSQLDMSAAKPAHKEIKGDNTINNKENKALKFFQ